MDELGRICFRGVCLDGNGSFLTVDIHKYDRMEVGVVELPALAGRPAIAPRTEVTFWECATGTSLEISDAPMNHAEALHNLRKNSPTAKMSGCAGNFFGPTGHIGSRRCAGTGCSSLPGHTSALHLLRRNQLLQPEQIVRRHDQAKHPIHPA